MLPDEILSLLTQLLGPFKEVSQETSAGFEKFEELLKQALSQPTLDRRQTGFPLRNDIENLPEEIRTALVQLVPGIVQAQAARKPADPVFWLRQRNVAVANGFEKTLENYLEPEFSFGPFLTKQGTKTWFDFFQVAKQLRFRIFEVVFSDFLVITLPATAIMPLPGNHSSLSFDDCTLWLSVAAVSPVGAKKYAGVRAKNCRITFPGIASMQSPDIIFNLSPGIQISFEPFDKYAGDDPQPHATYPNRIELSFAVKVWSLAAFGKSAITTNGDDIQLAEGENIQPEFLEAENLIHFPLQANKASWEINSNNTERFQLTGTSELSNPGWYLPVVNAANSPGMGGLGTAIFSGYLGFRGLTGLSLGWPGLENGKLTINRFLLLTRPSRMHFDYTYSSNPRIKQQLAAWRTAAVADDRNTIKLVPLLTGEGSCLQDHQQMEMLLQTALVTITADRPLNTEQQRFSIAAHPSAAIFLKLQGESSIFMVGSRPPPKPLPERKPRIPQSLCLRNALLTTDNPTHFFLQGRLPGDDVIVEGSFHPAFPVYRLINTLPDPYISNQEGIFEQEFEHFNKLWRLKQDTLNDQFLFQVTATVQWNEEETALSFATNQRAVSPLLSDRDIFRLFNGHANLCGLDSADGIDVDEISAMRGQDATNVVGAYDYLQLLPGDRSLVDVSGSANYWGVSFSTTIEEHKKILTENLGYPARFPFRIKNMDLISSGRLARLFTLPHIQWEPVMNVENSMVNDPGIPDIINFNGNGNPTRIASAQQNDVVLVPRELYRFIVEGFNSAENSYAIAANFSLPFGICALAYFNPKAVKNKPTATVLNNAPIFSSKRTGALEGGLQLQVKAVPPVNLKNTDTDNSLTYFIGSARQLSMANGPAGATILGNKISSQFLEFSGRTAKLPLQQIDFAGYGASIFSNWRNEKANFGRVNQVRFDVLIGRTAHEVVQIKSILYPWGVPVVRSVVMQRKNSGMVTRYDSGWLAQGPGEFDFRSHVSIPDATAYNFHPGLVKGIYNVKEIRDLPQEMDIILPKASKNRFTGVYFNGDIEIENISTGALPKIGNEGTRVHSAGQFGYVLLADTTVLNDTTLLEDIVPPKAFRDLLTDPKIGGSLGGPVDAVINIAGTGQRMQITRVDISASNETNPGFVVAVRGTIQLPKEGSWNVVKCLPSKQVVPLIGQEAVPIIRNGLLSFPNGIRLVTYNNSHHSLGDPAEINKYVPGGVEPALQYSFLQTTDAQKILFRRPSFFEKAPGKINTQTPEFADAFRLLKCKTIFPDLSQALSLPAGVDNLLITGAGQGLKFDEKFFNGPGPLNLNDFSPPELKTTEGQVYKLIDETGFKVWIRYVDKNGDAGKFQVDLNSNAVSEAADGARKKWQTVNKDVTIEVHLGPLQPMLTLKGTFRSEAGQKPVFENPALELVGADLKTVRNILQVLATLAGEGDAISKSLVVSLSNSPDSWDYKMSIDQHIPVLQFPNTAQITLTTPPPLIIEASLVLGVFFNLSLSPDPANLIRPGAGASFGFEGMLQIQLITIGIAAAYGVGITKITASVDLTRPTPEFVFTFGFGATVIVSLPVVGMVSVTRSFSLTGNIDSGGFLIEAGQMLRGVLSLAGGLLMVSIQLEGKTGLLHSGDAGDKSTKALFTMIFSLDVSLAFVISYDFTKTYHEEITLS